MRASELYRLSIKNIDFSGRKIEILKTKNGVPRVIFFTEEAKEALLAYCKNKPSRIKNLFGEYHVNRRFRDSPIRVKDLRKYFLQKWNKEGGNYLMGEVLTGHSIKNNISLSHYVAFSLEEIKKEYDRVMCP